jgi:hypothetical protein
MLTHFGWKAVIGIISWNLLYLAVHELGKTIAFRQPNADIQRSLAFAPVTVCGQPKATKRDHPDGRQVAPRPEHFN